MLKKFTVTAVAAALLTTTGCASITGPGRQPVKINSTPQGASVFVGGRTATTPAVVELKGKSEYFVKAEKKGYKDSTDVIGSEVRILPAVVGNILNLTGIIGVAVDFLATGAAYDMDDEINIKLEKQ